MLVSSALLLEGVFSLARVETALTLILGGGTEVKSNLCTFPSSLPSHLAQTAVDVKDDLLKEICQNEGAEWS